MLSVRDVVAASAAVGNRVHRTPTFTSRALAAAVDARAHLKAELFQKTGSFKPRGTLAKVASLDGEERARGVITTSAGNLASGLAYACGVEGVDCLVVMWRGASEQKIAAARRYGARVDLATNDPGAAFERMLDLERESGRTLVHPWDDPLVLAGHGTVGLEIVEDVPDVEVVVVPVGGGGLISGIATAVKGARPDARVIGVEPERAAGLHDGLRAGTPVRVPADSIADGLNAPFAGERCLGICRELVDDLVLVSEREIEDGFRFLYGRAKLAAEPAGAVSVAALLAGKVGEVQGRSIVAVVSGGNVSAQTASAILGRE